MKRRITIALAALMIAALCACGAAAEEEGLAARATAVYEALAAGDYAQVAARFDETMAQMLDEDALAQAMQGVYAQLGAMTGAQVVQTDEALCAAALLVAHENGQSALQMTFDSEGRLSGMVLSPLPQSDAAQALSRELPEGAQASEVALFPGTARELGGELIVPAGAGEETVYVVFVHGSGPSDRDESVGANKPFRDLAYDLAALGVGSLRFDKITYAAPGWQPMETIDDEYLQPVAEALAVLRERTGAKRVYLVGHSEGAMLAPYLVEQCGFDGGIALAGTPKQLWEISWAQNVAMLDMLEGDAREVAQAQLDAEAERAKTLADMSDEEAESATVFGVSAVYLRHMARMDQAQIAKDSGKPFLFLWGTADVQVDFAAFTAWNERLGDGPFTYTVYPGLNHLFIPAQEGENIMNVMEAYGVPSRVDERVAQDIASWIDAQR